MLLDRRQLSPWGRGPGSSLPRAGRSSASAPMATGLGARRLGGAGRQPGTHSYRWRWSGQRPRARRRQRPPLMGWGCHGTVHPSSTLSSVYVLPKGWGRPSQHPHTTLSSPASPAVCRAVVSTPWSSVVKWAVGRQSPYGEGEAHPACPALPPKRTHTSGQPPPRGEEAEPGPLGRHPARSLPPSLLPTRE